MKTILFALLIAAPVHAQEVGVRVDQRQQDSDTTVTIHKGPPTAQAVTPQNGPDFQVVENSDDISGEPASSRDESYQNWKSACNDWKKDLKETNGRRLISANCGKPALETDPVTFKKTQSSTGKYKVRLSNRDRDNERASDRAGDRENNAASAPQSPAAPAAPTPAASPAPAASATP